MVPMYVVDRTNTACGGVAVYSWQPAD